MVRIILQQTTSTFPKLNSMKEGLSDWLSGKALASHCWDPGLIHNIACEMVMWSRIPAGGFPPHEDHTNANNSVTSINKVLCTL